MTISLTWRLPRVAYSLSRLVQVTHDTFIKTAQSFLPLFHSQYCSWNKQKVDCYTYMYIKEFAVSLHITTNCHVSGTIPHVSVLFITEKSTLLVCKNDRKTCNASFRFWTHDLLPVTQCWCTPGLAHHLNHLTTEDNTVFDFKTIL